MRNNELMTEDALKSTCMVLPVYSSNNRAGSQYSVLLCVVHF